MIIIGLFLAFVLYFIYVYAAIFILCIIAQIVRKKILPWPLLFVQTICFVIFFCIQDLVETHKIVFTGKYEDGSKDWGSGLANVYTTFINHGILVLIFILSQAIFLYFFIRKLTKLNKPDLTKDFLKQTVIP